MANSAPRGLGLLSPPKKRVRLREIPWEPVAALKRRVPNVKFC